MKRQSALILALALAVAPLTGLAATAVTTDASPQPPARATDSASKLSATAREVVKMAQAGVPDDVVKAYVENSSSTFNLTSENIIHLQELSISGPVTTAMLNHDTVLRDRAGAVASTAQAAAAVQPQPITAPDAAYPAAGAQPDYGYTVPPQVNYYYDQPAVYGSWPYGWDWQPYVSLGFYGYPWGGGFRHYNGWHHYSNHGWFGAPGFRAHNGNFSGSVRFGSGFHNFSSGVSRSGAGGHFGGTRGGFHR